MNPKKCLVLIVAFAVCLIGLNTTLWGQEPKDPNDKIKVLQEKIKQLESVVRHTENEKAAVVRKLDEQIKENERLKRLCSQAGIDTSPQKDKKPSKVEDANFSNVGLEDLTQFVRGPLTELQKKELYKNYEGKLVQWTGIVSSVSNVTGKGKDAESSYSVIFVHPLRHTPFLLYNINRIVVDVKFQESLKQSLLSLNQGSQVTYQGKLPDSYDKIKTLLSLSAALSLTDGRIISVKP
jgi:hypothetical protein